MARYRIHFLDGSAVDLDAPSAADARARFDNRGIARVKVIRGEATLPRSKRATGRSAAGISLSR